jgi:hypothetical protein
MAVYNHSTLVLKDSQLYGKFLSLYYRRGSRNSEMIHAVIYYSENNLKAELYLNGAKQLYQFCQEYAIPYLRI